MNILRNRIFGTLFLALALSPIIAWAARGPCYYSTSPTTQDNTECEIMCGGFVYTDTGCRGCQGVNENDCMPTGEGKQTYYPIKPGSCSHPAECFVDLAGKTTVGNGCANDCIGG